MTEPLASFAQQATLVAALRDPRCYPHAVGSIEVIETHISWVVLTGTYAYKIKKPLVFDFLDFASLGQREQFCREELRLNRRLEPELYLDVVAITGTPTAPVIAGSGETVEWAVKMREFERGAELSRLLKTGAVTTAIVDEIADRVAAFHATCDRDTSAAGFGSAAAIYLPVRENIDALARLVTDPGARDRLTRLAAWSEAEHGRLTPTFERRRAEGFVRECHGDLHLGNIALHGGRVVLFDCIEFNPGLRWIDVMSDVAFLVMDLHQRERPDFARRCLNRWLERSGDYEGLAVLHYYLVYRALVRAKVAAIRATQGGAQAANAASESQALLDLGERFARTGAPQLLITQGVSGSGKTTVTSALLELANLIRIRSDVERKRLFALSSEARSGSNVDAGIYAWDATQRTYARLLALSQGILRAGHSVVVDATFLDRSDRDAFRALAAVDGARFRILACRAHRETLRERVVMREQHERDASEAGLPVLARQLEQGVELGDDELQEATLIDTSSPIDTRALANALGLLP